MRNVIGVIVLVVALVMGFSVAAVGADSWGRQAAELLTDIKNALTGAGGLATSVKITDGTDTAQVTAAGEQNVLATAQPGVDIGDVTINNAAGASAVNVQDGGNSLTVDGTVSITPPTGVSATEVQGTAADNAPAVGSPVLTGCLSRASTFTSTAGDSVACSVEDSTGALHVGFDSGNSTGQDGDSNTLTKPRGWAGSILDWEVYNMCFNGTTWDRCRGDTSGQWVVLKKAPTASTIDTSFTAQTADFTVEAATANLRLMGWSIREDAGTAAVATVVLRHDADGTCDSAAVVAFIELDANQSVQSPRYGDRGLAVPNGVCVDVLAGSVSFVAHFVTEAAP